MPTYEYKCPKCQITWETTFSMDEVNMMRCSDCGEMAERVYGSFGLIFKGTGWGKD